MTCIPEVFREWEVGLEPEFSTEGDFASPGDI